MLKSLDEFNAERRRVIEEIDHAFCGPHGNGIACPSCGQELVDSHRHLILNSSPPQKGIHCQSCDYRGYRVA